MSFVFTNWRVVSPRLFVLSSSTCGPRREDVVSAAWPPTQGRDMGGPRSGACA
jgi:hypothetical protein